MRFHCVYPRNVHIKDSNKYKKWKQALKYFISIKLSWVSCRRAGTGWDFLPCIIIYTLFNSAVTASSEKIIYLEGQISRIAPHVTESLPKLDCISHYGMMHSCRDRWAHIPWKLHQKAIEFTGKISTYFERLRLYSTWKKKISGSLLAVPWLKALTFSIALPHPGACSSHSSLR